MEPERENLDGDTREIRGVQRAAERGLDWEMLRSGIKEHI